MLMREYAKDEKQAELLVRNVGNAVMKAKELTDKEDEYPLAVLAAEITDNPHYFDLQAQQPDCFFCTCNLPLRKYGIARRRTISGGKC
ncbi:MAG: TIGR02679 domain-containing protein [Enterocloster clostridioformis]